MELGPVDIPVKQPNVFFFGRSAIFFWGKLSASDREGTVGSLFEVVACGYVKS
jgi:hypothetical protein